MTMRRIGLLGGSFDPPHLAHLFAASTALATGKVEQVWLQPVFEHPFGKEMADYAHRVAMCRLLIAPYNVAFGVSELERELGETSYTVRTLQHLKRAQPDRTFFLILGADALAERDEWKDFQQIEKLVELIVVGRAGCSGEGVTVPITLPEISSTDIRTRVREGQSLDGYVATAVAEYIERNQLYR